MHRDERLATAVHTGRTFSPTRARVIHNIVDNDCGQERGRSARNCSTASDQTGLSAEALIHFAFIGLHTGLVEGVDIQ